MVTTTIRLPAELHAKLKKEIDSLRSQISTLKALYLTTIIIFVMAVIIFQIQYSNVQSYYRATYGQVQDAIVLLENLDGKN